ncbi:PREDICTED: uncharacterized protein LOC109224495 [Nicotiana attenuata]|uniref:uncharacterized protein LOC109224495 n=1 Tax=Nicotiana attenuata TaxID=49451 RepID=UPI000904A04E|nr:PREDICTED: uncharacterized protein LOC109224495 [Nicotiana attenuata]
MSEIRSYDTPSRRAPPLGYITRAIYQMWNGYRWAPLSRTRCVRQNTRTGSYHIHMEKHHMPFRHPQEISCDNRPQIIGKTIAEFFEKWHIKRILSTLYRPAGNGQAESSNKTILNILKKKLEDTKGLWPELLPEVLWSYRTTPKTSTGETPYSLVYGTDAMIPAEVGELSPRYSNESG